MNNPINSDENTNQSHNKKPFYMFYMYIQFTKLWFPITSSMGQQDFLYVASRNVKLQSL